MGQIRIGFQRVSAGSAARAAEDERKGLAPAPSLRIPAGSAARAAEEAKRAGQPHASGAAGFSLRAQGGRVVRTEEQRAAPTLPLATPDSPQATPKLPQTLHAAAPRPRSAEVATEVSPPRADPPPRGAGRLQTFLRGFFRPDKPSNP